MSQSDRILVPEPDVGWRRRAGQVSLAEVHRSVVVPVTASFWRKLLAFTALDVLAVLYLQQKGFRYIEALVITLIATIAGCFSAELIFSKPNLLSVVGGFVPGSHIIMNQQMLYVSIGILGATVMPHNLYLHSSIVQTRKFEQTPQGKREAIKYASIDSTGALMFALFINAAILVLATSLFHWSGHQEVAALP